MLKWFQNRAKLEVKYTDYMGRDSSAVVKVGTRLYNAGSLYSSGMVVTSILPKYDKLELNFRTAITRGTLISRLSSGTWYLMGNSKAGASAGG